MKMKKNEYGKRLLTRMCLKSAGHDCEKIRKSAGLYDWFWKRMGNSALGASANKRQGIMATSGVSSAGDLPTIGRGRKKQVDPAHWQNMGEGGRLEAGNALLAQQQKRSPL